jgi:hypothetical protein
MINEGEVRKAAKYGELLLLALKASGGYRFRALIKLSDTELDRVVETSSEALRDLCIRVTVAERMLQEKPPSYHERWDEYQGRLKEAKGILAVGQGETQRKGVA